MPIDALDRLIRELARLPGIGERTAARLAFYLIKGAHKDAGRQTSLAHDLAHALLMAADSVTLCTVCRNFSQSERCPICVDPHRDPSLLCIVEGVPELRAIETSLVYHGRYHVLHGALAPLDGIGPAELKLDALKERVLHDHFCEVIVATNADACGDATALYIGKMLQDSGVRLTRLAAGIPLGGELEYMDQATLGRAILERRDL